MEFKRNNIKNFWYVLCLLFPIIARFLFIDVIETSLTFSFLDYPLFLPEILFFFLPFLWKPAYGRNWKFVVLGVIGLFYLFINCLINDIPTLYHNFIGGTDFFICFIILGFFPISFEQLMVVRKLLLITFLLVCAQVILFSSGILSYSGANGSTDDLQEIGSLIRFKTSAGSAIKTGFILLILSSLLHSLYYQQKYFRSGILLLALVAIAMTLSRGPLIVFLVFFIYITRKIITSFFKGKFLRHFPLYIIGGFLIVLAMIKLDSALGISRSFMARIDGNAISNDVTSGRDIRYQYALDIIKDNLLFGAGSGNTKPYERTGSIEITSKSYDKYHLSPHNSYLLFLADYGLIGFLIFVLIFIQVFKVAFKYKKLNSINLCLLSIVILSMNTEIIFLNMDMLMLLIVTAYISGSKKILYEA